ncbi:MAG: hypothetical protein IT361_03045 [Gemmatimonadaceae bacterium]|nr:hypothetical protein [Gemmatimonadaceae bacterium]
MDHLEAFKQLASRAAVLCGFSFTFLALLLGLKDHRAMVSVHRHGDGRGSGPHASHRAVHLPVVCVERRPGAGECGLGVGVAGGGWRILVGVAMLLASLAVSGSIHSRRMGYLSTGSACVVAVGIVAGVVAMGRALGAG